jgi:hypothetical protein
MLLFFNSLLNLKADSTKNPTVGTTGQGGNDKNKNIKLCGMII